MEDTLRDPDFYPTPDTVIVLILVLMEDTLREPVRGYVGQDDGTVLILVLMEDTLRGSGMQW